jgi:hypothetical protein
MTSRREFFGLLAAAPVAIPAIAKELAAPKSLLMHFEMSAGELLPSRDLTRGRYGKLLRVSDDPPTISINSTRRRNPYAGGDDSYDAECLAWNDRHRIRAPNRLFGAYINEDGDAV